MFASRIKDIRLSGIRKMFEMADSDAIHLGIGEPDFQPPVEICEELKKSIDDGYNKYGSSAGIPELRNAIADDLKKYRKDIDRDNIVVTIGATEAFMITFQTFIEKGDEVLIPDPGFVLYGPQVRICGGKPVSYLLNEELNFTPQQDDIQNRITEKTKAIVVNSPSNPTGAVMDTDVVDMIVDIATDNNLLIISDEVYDKIIYEKKHASFLGRYDDMVYINSFSKRFCTTGWRIGYLASSKKIVSQLLKMHYYTVACPPMPTQYAVLKGLQNQSSKNELDRMVKIFKERRDTIVKKLNDISGVRCVIPQGAFYVFPSFDFKISSQELAIKLLENGVVSTPGIAFGQSGEHHLRFSYAISIEKINKGMEIVEKTVSNMC